MNQLYPMQFKPVFKDKIWGGMKIKTELGLDYAPLPNCGEVWALSGIEDNNSEVANGFLEGNELNELVEVYMGDLVGDAVYEKFGNEFPILIKFIDANDYLSIQVHPDDALAAKRKIGYGKSEMWYILQADEKAELITGFNQKVNKESYIKHLQNKTLKQILNIEKVKKDEVFYIPAGRVHALGPGLLLAEIQQTSDTTYRIYDWDRLDDKGNPRQLHVEEALDAIDFEVYDNYKTNYPHTLNKTVNVVETPFFTTNVLQLDKKLEKNYEELDSFVIFVCIHGKGELHYGSEKLDFKKGEVVLLPANINKIQLLPLEEIKLLEVYII
ncbi:MAG: class I mannose-6-phosphate isomerase [Bacteroidetes bacterium]|nr:class I mannose-6-phosphate isomerase [Bacteroidota bacterium]